MTRRRRGRDVVSELREDAHWSWFTNTYVRGRFPLRGVRGLRDQGWSLWAVMGGYLMVVVAVVAVIGAAAFLVQLLARIL